MDPDVEGMESLLKDFQLEHREYVMKIVEVTMMDEVIEAINECSKYLKEVVGQTNDVLALYFDFKGKLQVLRLRKLTTRLQEYIREGSRVEIAVSKFGRDPKEAWEGSRSIIHMGRNLQEAFEGVVNVARMSQSLLELTSIKPFRTNILCWTTNLLLCTSIGSQERCF